jgi:elongator complex protein 5
VNQLIFGTNGDGSGFADELVVEVLARATDGSGRKRGVERVLEGWRLSGGPCDLSKLDSIKAIFAKALPETVRAHSTLDPGACSDTSS